MERVEAFLSKMKKEGVISEYSSTVKSPFISDGFGGYKSVWKTIGVKTVKISRSMPPLHHAIIDFSIKFATPRGEIPFNSQIQDFKQKAEDFFKDGSILRGRQGTGQLFALKVPVENGGLMLHFTRALKEPRSLSLRLFAPKVPIERFPKNAIEQIMLHFNSPNKPTNQVSTALPMSPKEIERIINGHTKGEFANIKARRKTRRRKMADHDLNPQVVKGKAEWLNRIKNQKSGNK